MNEFVAISLTPATLLMFARVIHGVPEEGLTYSSPIFFRLVVIAIALLSGVAALTYFLGKWFGWKDQFQLGRSAFDWCVLGFCWCYIVSGIYDFLMPKKAT